MALVHHEVHVGAAGRALGNSYCSLAHAKVLSGLLGLEATQAMVAGRAFFTRILDGLGAEPDAAFRELPPE
ncbi:hypothetical protein [Halomonas alkalisoli]|uniref:hypothetical protein n=1 Tax=Halomonas alkalisoli TaxID=2907158 RepID=UPI001F2D3444|nr:hypothetical protein [Halomonas alkalisoli]MCE9681481.1 hypothetical protein [Halomonas alkalisoli]